MQALLAHAGAFAVDGVVVQSPELPADAVAVDDAALEFLRMDVVKANVAAPDGTHDPELLARVLSETT